MKVSSERLALGEEIKYLLMRRQRDKAPVCWGYNKYQQMNEAHDEAVENASRNGSERIQWYIDYQRLRGEQNASVGGGNW